MEIDIALFIAIGVLSVLMAVLGGYTASSNTAVRIAFIIMGVASVVCIVWEGERLQAPATPSQIAEALAPMLGGKASGPPPSVSAREIAGAIVQQLNIGKAANPPSKVVRTTNEPTNSQPTTTFAIPSNDELRTRTRVVTDRIIEIVNVYQNKVAKIESAQEEGKHVEGDPLADLKAHLTNDEENLALFQEANTLDAFISAKIGTPLPTERRFPGTDPSAIYLRHTCYWLEQSALKLPL